MDIAACGHPRYGKTERCGEMICKNYSGRQRMTPEEFVAEANKLQAEAEQMRARLDAIWNAIAEDLGVWEIELARAEFVSLLKNWGSLAPLVENWVRAKEQEEAERA